MYVSLITPQLERLFLLSSLVFFRHYLTICFFFVKLRASHRATITLCRKFTWKTDRIENSKYFEFQSELNERMCSRVAVLFETERSTVFHSSTLDRQHKNISTHTNTPSSTGRFEVSMYCLVQRIGRTIVAGIYRNFPHIFLLLFVCIWKMWKLISLFPEDFNAFPHYLCWSCWNWFTMQCGATVGMPNPNRESLKHSCHNFTAW